MADYTKTAVGEIRDFLWTQLKNNTLLNKNDYIADGFIQPLIPIIPAQQVPEFNNLISGKTYIVYDFQIGAYDSDYWICEENLILYIISPDYGKGVQIINFLIDLFRRMDDSAKDVNSSLISDLFKFHYFYINSAESPSPMEEEGGNQIATVDISYKYSREIGENGRFL
jgi:hypothetical protein